MKTVKPPFEPLYDETYFEGMRWLNWIARYHDAHICRYFYKECECLVCPCEKYEAEE